MSICPKCPFASVPIGEHFGEISPGHLGYPFRALGIIFSPKCLFAPSVHLPHRPFVNIWGEMGIRHLGYPVRALEVLLSPKCPFALVPICKHFGEMSPWHLGYHFRALGVSLSSKCPFVLVPICPTAHLQTFEGRVRVEPWASAEKKCRGGKNILEMAILVKAIVR